MTQLTNALYPAMTLVPEIAAYFLEKYLSFIDYISRTNVGEL